MNKPDTLGPVAIRWFNDIQRFTDYPLSICTDDEGGFSIEFRLDPKVEVYVDRAQDGKIDFTWYDGNYHDFPMKSLDDVLEEVRAY